MGFDEGLDDGAIDGVAEGSILGFDEGLEGGALVGVAKGSILGSLVIVGSLEGTGLSEGERELKGTGLSDGEREGAVLGSLRIVGLLESTWLMGIGLSDGERGSSVLGSLRIVGLLEGTWLIGIGLSDGKRESSVLGSLRTVGLLEGTWLIGGTNEAEGLAEGSFTNGGDGRAGDFRLGLDEKWPILTVALRVVDNLAACLSPLESDCDTVVKPPKISVCACGSTTFVADPSTPSVSACLAAIVRCLPSAPLIKRRSTIKEHSTDSRLPQFCTQEARLFFSFSMVALMRRWLLSCL